MTLDGVATCRYSSGRMTRGGDKSHAELYQIETSVLCKTQTREGEDKPQTGRKCLQKSYLLTIDLSRSLAEAPRSGGPGAGRVAAELV